MTPKTPAELRLAAADYIERAGYAQKPDGSPSVVSRARVRDDSGKWLPQVDVYRALSWVAGNISSGPAGWVSIPSDDRRWDIVRAAWEDLGRQYCTGEPYDHFGRWEYRASRTLDEILIALRNV